MQAEKNPYSKILRKAIAVAYAGACSHMFTECGYSHHCAVICSNRGIVSIGKNKHNIHAEAAALYETAGQTYYAIVILRVYADGYFGLANSMPCVDCTKLIKESGIQHIFYSNGKGEIVHCDAKSFTSDFVTLKNRLIAEKKTHT